MDENRFMEVLVDRTKLVKGEDGTLYYPLSEDYRLIIREGIIEGDYDPNLGKII